MPIEYLATELQRKQDLKQFTFRDLGAVYIDYTHTFSTEILEDKLPEETARKRKRRRKPNIDEKEELEKLLLKRFDEAQIVSKESPFRGLQINTKISEMREFLQEEREIALQLKIRDSALQEKEKARLRRLLTPVQLVEENRICNSDLKFSATRQYCPFPIVLVRRFSSSVAYPEVVDADQLQCHTLLKWFLLEFSEGDIFSLIVKHVVWLFCILPYVLRSHLAS